ncbi:MAG: RagB/SusD family nutrient uptake outer membrane protein [Cytophagaceae bacterium]|nr:RagB/SusD family nutrient uptake outer membrane protein [Cytophagaceae bacterium]
MNRTTFKSSLLIAATIAVLTGCGDRLNVLPTQTIDEQNALNTSNDVAVTLIGAYDGVQSGDVLGGAFQYIPDLLGDNAEVRFGGTFGSHQEIWNKTIAKNNTQVAATWIVSYNAINRVNNVLSAIDKVDAASKARIEGEARFLRGFVYFELVKLYAKAWGNGDNATNPGVPLVLTPTRVVDASSNVKRNSVAEVYTQVIDDLTKAESLLPASNGYYATKSAAAAVLSRVYLMQLNYAGARDAANRVIMANRYKLTDTYKENFNTFLNYGGADPSETIFSIQVNQQDGGSSLNTFYGVTIGSVPGTAGRGDVRIQTKHTSSYEAGDDRGTFFTRVGSNVYSLKFVDRYGNVPLIRLAEMYLTRAEANFRLTTTTGAAPLADINLIRARALLPPLTTLTLDIAAILKERKLELMFEGHLLPDLKRTRRSVGSLAWSADALVLPIPQREIDANPNLTQNPGY